MTCCCHRNYGMLKSDLRQFCDTICRRVYIHPSCLWNNTVQIFRRFKLHVKYGMILLFALLNCAAFAASPTAKQSIEKQSKLTIKPHLQNKSQHHQHLKTTVPPIKPAPRILEAIPKDPNSIEPRRIIDIAPPPQHQDLSQRPSSAPTSTQAND